MAAELPPGKIAIPALAVTAYTAKKPKKRKSEEEKKDAVRLVNQRRAKTRINIGPAYSRWRALRASLGLTLDVQVAVFLLDRAEAASPPVCDFVKMPKDQTLRALVQERLAAAAEDTLVLFERTIAEHEEELSRYKEENQRKQQLLDQVFSPRIEMVRGNVQMPSSPGPGLNQDITETSLIKAEPEEQSVKQEEEQLPVAESKVQMLRAQVHERLAAAAEDTYVLFERTIAEHEEEQRRSEEENQRKQRLVDNVFNPKVVLVRRNVQIPSSPGSGPNHDITETPLIKEEPEEQNVKQEEEQPPVFVLESSAVCVKTQESSLFQQTEHREEKRDENKSSETHFHSENVKLSSDTDNHDEPSSCSAAQMETEVDGEHVHQVQTRDRSTELSLPNKSAPETSVHKEDESGADGKKLQDSVCKKRNRRKQVFNTLSGVHTGEDVSSEPHFWSEVNTGHSSDPDNEDDADWDLHSAATDDHVQTRDRSTESGADGKKLQDSVCKKKFRRKHHLQRDRGVHTGERRVSCGIIVTHKHLLDSHMRTHTGDSPNTCKKTFKQKKHLNAHMGEKPYRCSVCEKAFHQKSSLNIHMRTHTGEKPYSCLECNKAFAKKTNLDSHKVIHTGEKPYSCPVCYKAFKRKGDVKSHEIVHTGEKPYTCPLCDKAFSHKGTLNRHKTTHTKEKPYSCTLCQMKFSTKDNLRSHMKIHTSEKPHSCPQCNKTFVRKGDLNVHMRTHTGDKPYRCSD